MLVMHSHRCCTRKLNERGPSLLEYTFPQAGWYLNGCKCGERVEKRINYAGDITSLHNFNFDGVKIDVLLAKLNIQPALDGVQLGPRW